MNADDVARRPYQHTGEFSRLAALESEAIVFRVRADPKPRDNFRLHGCQARDGVRRFVRHKCRFTVPRISKMDGKDPAARARISRARVFESGRAARRSASRTARAFCRSREVLHTTRPNVCLNFFGNRMQPPVVREVAVDLAIPASVVALPDKGGELRQFIGGESIYRTLYFGETHRWNVFRTRQEGNSHCNQIRSMIKITRRRLAMAWQASPSRFGRLKALRHSKGTKKSRGSGRGRV